MKKIVEENILGVNIAVTNIEEVTKYIYNNLEKLKGEYICVSNVHTTVMSYEDENYKKVQNTAILRLPDGKPLSTVQKKRGHQNAMRVTGPDLMQKIFADANYKGIHYFYGSTQETLDQLKQKLEQNYSNLNIVGFYSPPFKKLTKEEDERIIEMINKSGANIVWVGLGAPKQENWMYEHRHKIDALMIGVGAGFDYHAGNIKRAPKWMQKCSLEWLYRLLQDPKRLFKRYMTTNFKFLKYIKMNKTLVSEKTNEKI